MKQVSIMLKPASSLCNLRCKYCFYADVALSEQVSADETTSLPTLLAEGAARLLAPIL